MVKGHLFAPFEWVKNQIEKINNSLSDYAKITDIPTELPANGGNSNTVNNHTVNSDVPANAKFTDTVYDDSNITNRLSSAESNLTSHTASTTAHVSDSERTLWNGVSNKVDKVSGKQLSTNDFTSTLLSKLNGIEAGANKYVLPDGLTTGYITTGNKTDSTLGSKATAEGSSNVASGECAHAEGASNTATGSYSHAEGYSTDATAKCAHTEGWETNAKGDYSHAEGYYCTASNECSHVEGYQSSSSGKYAHAEGYKCKASGQYSHAEGSQTEATDNGAHAEGFKTIASGSYSHAEGYTTTASNYASHVCGKYNKALTAGGTYNNTTGDVFVVGNGTGSSALSNAFRVTYTGASYGLSAFNSSGADYAEFVYPWFDNNENDEDRVGYFVTFKDGKLYKATSKDIVLGIISGNPSIVGNADEDYYWKYERDEFNRVVFEDVEEEIEKVDEDDNIVYDENGDIVMKKTGKIIKNARMKLNSDYDPSLQNEYVERKYRKEWDYVGMLGVLPTRDDGTCIAGQYCKCNDDGIATLATPEDVATNRFTFIVLERVSDNIIKIKL